MLGVDESIKKNKLNNADDLNTGRGISYVLDHKSRSLAPLSEPCVKCGQTAYFKCGARTKKNCGCNRFSGCDLSFCKNHIHFINGEDNCVCSDCKEDFMNYTKKKKWSWRLVFFAYIFLTVILPIIIWDATNEDLGFHPKGESIPYEIKYNLKKATYVPKYYSYSN